MSSYSRNVTSTVFGLVFDAAREASPRIAEATSPFEVSTDAAHFLAEDGRSGFVIRTGGELTNVFSTVSGRGDELVAAAIAAGATHLDCFEGYLTALYGRHGFVETAREANWTPGGPAVVWMGLPVVETVARCADCDGAYVIPAAADGPDFVCGGADCEGLNVADLSLEWDERNGTTATGVLTILTLAH